MKICVAGLGIIGGSLCLSLKRAGYEVSGWNRSPSALNFALSHNIIDKSAESFEGYDVVFVALPPKATVDFINSHAFKKDSIVSDICGVKGYLEREIYSVERNFRYVGCHPMAGKEVSGIENACVDLFDRASMVITSSEKTERGALETIRTLTKDMGFKYIVECSAAVHDKKIAYTSQLAHIVSNCYVKDGELCGCSGFTGGSFQDMTRIAGVDENMWASLYLLNSENLVKNINSLVSALEEVKLAIERGDENRLKGILSNGSTRFKSEKSFEKLPYVNVIKLK